MKSIKSLLAAAVSIVLITACTTDNTPLKEAYLDLPETPYKYSETDNNNVATLGRVLFYDRQLSVNNSVSCSSCHKQNLAFADNVAFSKGFENRVTSRNSMPIQNLGANLGFFPGGSGIFPGGPQENTTDPFPGNNPSSFFGSEVLFWDGRESSLQSMVLKPIGNHVEMGIRDMDDLSKKLSTIPYYKNLFLNAYGTEDITSDRIASALRNFLISITSTNTKFDKSLTGQAQLTALESRGLDLFFKTYDCNSCHQIQSPHGYLMAGTFSNIGLDAEYADTGLQEVSQRSEDAGKFKIPSLRNVSLTAPYMHDGRFNTLDEVLNHYSGGIAANPNLDARLRKDGAPMRMEIPDVDKQAIIAFLNTLTDYEMISDKKFSNPFKAR